MDAQTIRQKYFDWQKQHGHIIIPRANLVPQDDPTTLFTGSGMQPLIQYLLGAPHPDGTRLADSQTCLRAEDIDEVGDNRHTTFFEMLGNWSLGDYFKAEQLPWFYSFLIDEIGLDANKLYATCFIGDDANHTPKDTQSAAIIQQIFSDRGIQAAIADIGTEADGYKRGIHLGERIFYYDASKNWWSRAGVPANMPEGEPGGPDSEVFYLFDGIEHDSRFGENCHPNCNCGRFLEIGNSVFMEYIRTKNGFEPLPKKNVDFGGGLERIAAAKNDDPDVFKISLMWPVIQAIEEASAKNYNDQTESMRIITDHLRAATWLGVDGVAPSNKEQGYLMRRLIRRAILNAHNIGIETGLADAVVPVVVDGYKNDFPEVAERSDVVISTIVKEEKLFRQTLRKGLRVFEKLMTSGGSETGSIVHDMKQKPSGEIITDFKQVLLGADIFLMYDTYGFPVELCLEEAQRRGIKPEENWRQEFDAKMKEQRERSQTASKGTFKGGLADHSQVTTKYHTATHLMYRALKNVLGEHVIQRGSNITAERLRFDFEHPQKMTPEEIKQVQDMVNTQIQKDWPVSWREEKTKAVLGKVLGAFGDRYGDTVKIYTVGDPDGDYYSREICGGPHVEHTVQLGEGGKVFTIIKEESSSAGVRRIKAILK